MTERPIIFSGDSVRKILRGDKTQTRRIIKPQPEYRHEGKYEWYQRDREMRWHQYTTERLIEKKFPFGKVGDRLWVREKWQWGKALPMTFLHAADLFPDEVGRLKPWKSPIHMPRIASRLTLQITKIRVERLQDASLDDLWAEGMRYPASAGAIQKEMLVKQFKAAWDKLNGKTFPWVSSPWVWVIEFEKVVTP